jgi:isoleucyl-tRNA synthetase
MQFPADFISEAVDQTRGWFYTLHVLATLLFDSLAFRHAIVLGLIIDEQGRKMSKRLGNVVEPMGVIAEAGADALRWYFYAGNPEVPSRFSARLVREAAQGFLLPLWNALSFFTIYANLDRWRPGEREVSFADRPPLDRWILLRLGRLLAETGEHLEGYRIADAARGIATFVDDLTNWYIRRSRDRFWAPAEPRRARAEAGKESAYQTLYEVLTGLARLLAPFTPFLADVLHRHLVRSQAAAGEAAESVHLEPWPEPAPGRQEPELEAAIAAAQRIVRLGHAARNDHGIRTRQPLSSVTVVTADPTLPGLVTPHAALVEDELNVKEIRWAEDRRAWVRHAVRPVFPRCGPRFGKRMPALKRALEVADGDALARRLEEEGRIVLDVAGEPVELTAEEVEVRLVEREGAVTQGDRELLVALDTALTPELLAEGLAREVVHKIQAARKEAGLDYADRIRVRYRADPELEAAIAAHRQRIGEETLAVELDRADAASPGLAGAPLEGHDFALAIDRLEARTERRD